MHRKRGRSMWDDESSEEESSDAWGKRKTVGFVPSGQLQPDQSPPAEPETTFSFSKQSQAPVAKSDAPTQNNISLTEMSASYGVGFKLLAKMGYKGGGAGARGQGIANPIDVKVREKHRALQEEGEKVDSNAAAPPTAMPQRGPEEPKRPSEASWRKTSKPKTKKVYKTAEEISEKVTATPILQKIVDMRGAQPRVLSSLENLDSQKEYALATRSGPLTPLVHNLRLLCDLSEVEIQALHRKLKHERDTLVHLHREQNTLQQQVSADHTQTGRSKELMDVLANGLQRFRDGYLSVDSLTDLCSMLQHKYPQEYSQLGLASFCVSLLMPLLRRTLASWEPLKQPTANVHLIKSWKLLLSDHNGTGSPLFDALIQESILPTLRNALINQWHARDVETALALCEAWEPILPRVTFDLLLNQVILPKLSVEVDRWNPRMDPVPVHSWLHPWLPMLGSQRMDPLWHPIRFKLSTCLAEWHPSDGSAFAMLHPWHKVFDQSSWESLLSRSILPKLVYVMREFVVNPRGQDISPFQWVICWAEVTPNHFFLPIIEQEFFPKWQHTLLMWLQFETPDYEEITRWYLGWKNMFPPHLLDHDRIKLQFKRALDVMNQVMAGINVTIESHTMPPPPAPPKTPAPPLPPTKPVSSTAATVSMDDWGVGLSFKEYLERVAEEQSVVMVPKKTMAVEGKQVYSFGHVSIYLDKGVVFHFVGQSWTPISVDDLLAEVRRR